MKSTIRLFKAVPIESVGRSTDESVMAETIKKGFIFAPEVFFDYKDKLPHLIDMVEQELGLSAEKMNSSFHKSWTKIREASIEQLVVEQIIHYITTYGFKKIGIYSEESVYIPNEKLEIPELKDGIKLVVIRGLTKKELKEKLLKLLQAGIALAEDTIKDVVDVSLFVGLTVEEVELVKNREVKVALYDYLNLVPENPVEFLRYLVFKATNKTLLIKNRATVDAIREGVQPNIVRLFEQYEKTCGLENLAQIFYRFKPLFLAFRTNSSLKRIINRIRRLAVENHKPLREDYLNNVTSKLKSGSLNLVDLAYYLDRVNTFRKIRLAYALKFRTKAVDSILYRIRSGRGYATKFEFDNQPGAGDALKLVLNSIVTDTAKNIRGKNIFIPENINYALPSTEKQFTGDFPSGTCVSVPRDMVFGIHWENVDENMIDLDLSLITADGGKVGWDTNYRTEERDILFSGDVTDAPRGASELFFVKKQEAGSFIMFVNYYNYDKEIGVPYKILVASDRPSAFKKNYTVDPNNVVAVTKSKIDQKQKILGLVTVTPSECKFYFVETSIGGSITSFGSEFADHARKYLFDFYGDTIDFKDILLNAGANLVDSKEKCDIDLSPENINKNSFLDLLK